MIAVTATWLANIKTRTTKSEGERWLLQNRLTQNPAPKVETCNRLVSSTEVDAVAYNRRHARLGFRVGCCHYSIP